MKSLITRQLVVVKKIHLQLRKDPVLLNFSNSIYSLWETRTLWLYL